MMDFAAVMPEHGPAPGKIEELEKARKQLRQEINRLEVEYSAATALESISEKNIARMLEGVAHDMEEVSR